MLKLCPPDSQRIAAAHTLDACGGEKCQCPKRSLLKRHAKNKNLVKSATWAPILMPIPGALLALLEGGEVNMKNTIFSMVAFVAITLSSPVLAVTCQVLEGDGGTGSGSTKIEAQKSAWRACIAKKVSQREGSRGPVSVDDGILDAQACMNAPIQCK